MATVADLHVVLLAAGFSSRLGQPKALAQVRGVSLLQRSLRLAVALPASKVIVVVPSGAARYRRQAGRLQVTWVRNAQARSGLASSVRCGLKAARFASAALVMPVDLAGLRLREMRLLLAHWRATPTRVVATRIVTSGTEHAGTPLILPIRWFPRALELEGDVGLRRLVAALPSAETILVDVPSAHADVDTPWDLAQARGNSRNARITCSS